MGVAGNNLWHFSSWLERVLGTQKQGRNKTLAKPLVLMADEWKV